jgi:hypothetical protein
MVSGEWSMVNGLAKFLTADCQPASTCRGLPIHDCRLTIHH